MIGPLDVLKDIVSRFEKAGIEYFLVGSLGAMYYSRPRFTLDIDLVVQMRASQIKIFEEQFPLNDYYCPPNEIVKDEVIRMGSFNLIHQETGIKIDIVLQKNTLFYQSEFQRRRKVQILPELSIYIASPEDLVIKKLEYYKEGGSEKHLLDIQEIVAETELDRNYINQWVQQLGLQTEWEKI